MTAHLTAEPPVGDRAAAGAAGGGRRRAGPGPGQGAGGPLSDLHRVRAGAGGRAGSRRQPDTPARTSCSRGWTPAHRVRPETSFTVRVGSAGPVPVTVPLDAGPVVLRADDETAAAATAWLVAQTGGRPRRPPAVPGRRARPHADPELALAQLVAARPAVHAAAVGSARRHRRRGRGRPAGPVAGRGGDPGRARRERAGRGGRARHPARRPASTDPSLSGLHLVFLAPQGQPAPPGMSTVDVSGGRCRVTVAGTVVDGVPDLVPPGYGRAVADRMSDS